MSETAKFIWSAFAFVMVMGMILYSSILVHRKEAANGRWEAFEVLPDPDWE